MKKLITLTAFICLFATHARASHLSGAEIRYTYTGNANDYVLTLTYLRDCSGIPQPAAVDVYAASSCLTNPAIFTLPIMSVSTLGTYCPGYSNSCQSISFTMPGFQEIIYEDTVSLPPCSDWVMYFAESARSSNILNLDNPGSQSLYIEATLDNSSYLNTNAWFPNPAPFVVAAGVPAYIPMNIVDAENDSLAIEWYQPLTVATPFPPSGVSSIPYAASYSISNPFGTGGIAQLDMQNNQLALMAPNVGHYVLAYKISEYRNGNLIGTTMRDFSIIAVNGPTAATIPIPDAGSDFHHVTCPGQSHSITVSFTDSTSTDSVSLVVTPPSLPGFSFSTIINNGVGGADATISWTTPATLNPATLPQFYINVYVEDNACPVHSTSNYAIAVQTAQCITDSVWAGDANGDYTVNILDPLGIAVAYGETGPVRPGATTNWQAEYCPAWPNSFSNGVDMKHADCNGDGVVDNADLPAVTANWGQVHLRGGSNAKTTGIPSLYFDVSNLQIIPGTTVSVPIILGDASSIVNSFYGLGTTINVSGVTPANTPTISYPANNWLGNSSNTVRYTGTQTGTTNNIQWAYARNDHQNVSGTYGQIATLEFEIPLSTPAGTEIDLQFANTHFIDNAMAELTGYSTLDTSVVTTPLHVSVASANTMSATVLPNPSSEQAKLFIQLSQNAPVDIIITDATGKAIYSHTVKYAGKEAVITLPQTASGIYFIRTTNTGDGQSVLTKWMRN